MIVVINGKVKYNPDGLLCVDCKLYQNNRCKLNKENPIQDFLAHTAYKKGKLCDRGKWVVIKEIR